jgi:hypothetical protein
MNIRDKSLFVFLAISLVNANCTTSTPSTKTNANQVVVTNAAINTASANANLSETPANNSLSTNSATAGSPSAVAAAYHQAMLKKDEATFRKTLSQATLREFSADAQAEGEKTLVGYWTGYGTIPTKFEARNEQISGDTALIEIKSSEKGWALNKLVRENNEWKLDLTRATSESLLKRSTGR